MKQFLNLFILIPQVILLLFRFIKNPKDNGAIFKVSALYNHPAWAIAVDYTKSLPGVDALVKEKYLANPMHDLKALEKLPPGTLGYEYAKHMIENNFSPDFYPRIKPDSDLNYIRQRANESHDVWHVVTGISTDSIGEVELLSLDLAQTRWPLASFVIGAALITTTLRHPDRIDDLGTAIMRGWILGKKMKPLMAYKWEQMWEQPLSDVRKELGVPEAKAS